MPGGRPTKMTQEVVSKLEEAFLWGCTDSEACLYADINPRTLYRYCEDNEEFSQRKEVLKQNPLMRSRRVVMDALDNGDLNTAHKVIDRKEGKKVAVSGPDDGPISIHTVQHVVVDPKDSSS